MKLILNDEIKVEGTLEELLAFLKEYKKLPKETIGPRITTNRGIWRDLTSCEGCPIYEKLKKGETVIGDGCSFCSKYPYKINCGDTLTKPEDVNISLTTTGTGATKLPEGTTVKLTMDATNDPNKQPFDEYASGLPVREAMTGTYTTTISADTFPEMHKTVQEKISDIIKGPSKKLTKKESEEMLKKCGVLKEDGTIVEEYQGMIKEIDK